MGWNKLNLVNLQSQKDFDREMRYTAILNFSRNLFHFLQRFSVSKTVFLEEHYREIETKRLKKLKSVSLRSRNRCLNQIFTKTEIKQMR